MKRTYINLYLAISVLVMNACDNASSLSPIETNTTISQITSSPSTIPGAPALVKTTLEFYREGKTYEIILGFAAGEAFAYATPPLKLSEEQSKEVGLSKADIKRYGDFDKDGEFEYIISLMYCSGYCLEEIRIYEYDFSKDSYYIADSFEDIFPATQAYEDLNKDGNPELVTTSFFCYQCEQMQRYLAAPTILRYKNGKFVDVTTEFPELIQKDAESSLTSAKANKEFASFYALPSYLYDMYRLGKINEARPIFDQVCKTVIMPHLESSNVEFDCHKFRNNVEKYIQEFTIERFKADT